MDEQVAPEIEPGQTQGSTASAHGVSPTVEPGGTLSYTPEDAPWGIKKIATRTREKALAAARRDGKNVGEWLTEAVDAYVEAKREPITRYDVLAPGTEIAPRDRRILSDLTIEEIHTALLVGEELRARMGWVRFPAGLGRAVHRALLARLGGGQ